MAAGPGAETGERPARTRLLSDDTPILLPRSGSLDARLFDLLGREISVVLSGVLEGGTHTVTVDGSRLSTGTYFCRIAFEGEARTSRLLVLR